MGSRNATENGSVAEIALNHPIGKSAWITARCMGVWDRELFYSHPIFAHTSPVHVRYRKGRIAKRESAEFLLGFLRKLEAWAEHEAYFQNSHQKAETLAAIRKGIGYFEDLLWLAR